MLGAETTLVGADTAALVTAHLPLVALRRSALWAGGRTELLCASGAGLDAGAAALIAALLARPADFGTALDARDGLSGLGLSGAALDAGHARLGADAAEGVAAHETRSACRLAALLALGSVRHALGLAIDLYALGTPGASDQVAGTGLISLETFGCRSDGCGDNSECHDGEHECLGEERGDHDCFL